MIVVSAEEVRRLLPMRDAIDIVRQAMIGVSAGRANMPLRTVMEIDGTNRLGIMPGAMRGPDVYGVKLISLFPGNPAKGLSSHIGSMVIFDNETGAVAGVIDADALTAIRTAAASAAATEVLARPDASRLAIIGTGEQAETHVEAISLVRDLSEVRVAGRTPDRGRDFADRIAMRHPGLKITAAVDAQDAVSGVDIVCTVTSSPQIVLHGDWIGAGVHVNAVGASIPTMQEIDTRLVEKSRLYVDFRPSALAQARDIIDAIASGSVSEAHIRAEIGEVFDGQAAGRGGAEDITLYRSLGVAAQDLACAHHLMSLKTAR